MEIQHTISTCSVFDVMCHMLTIDTGLQRPAAKMPLRESVGDVNSWYALLATDRSDELR